MALVVPLFISIMIVSTDSNLDQGPIVLCAVHAQ